MKFRWRSFQANRPSLRLQPFSTALQNMNRTSGSARMQILTLEYSDPNEPGSSKRRVLAFRRVQLALRLFPHASDFPRTHAQQQQRKHANTAGDIRLDALIQLLLLIQNSFENLFHAATIPNFPIIQEVGST